jgi:hypothetical protein
MAKKAKSKFKAPPKRDVKSISVKDFIDDYLYRIDLDADYQREKIWSRSDQEGLIDSIVQDIDIPKMYLMKVTGKENFDFECIDGKQRMTALLNFVKPDPGQSNPLTVSIAGKRYTYKALRKEWPQKSKEFDEYQLAFVIYPQLEDEFLREIFRRLQLGVRLNSGELLKTYMGAMRDFVYVELGNDAPFIRRTNLSIKRFSRQFTLAQICINSFSRSETGEFVRARYDDLGTFFGDKQSLRHGDENFVRIRRVLDVMDKRFKARAEIISSRAVAVSAYLFAEELYLRKKASAISAFAKFFEALIKEVKANLDLVAKYEQPTNTFVLEQFQKYVSQASVEPYAIKRRHEFLEKAFAYYRTRGKILSA